MDEEVSYDTSAQIITPKPALLIVLFKTEMILVYGISCCASQLFYITNYVPMKNSF